MTTGVTAHLPLTGCRILVTRARAQARDLSERLEELGAQVVELPAIEIQPAPTGALERAIDALERYDWVIFTSVNGVDAFFSRLDARDHPEGSQASLPADLRVAAIGRATAARLAARGIRVDFVPERFVAESVVEGLLALGVPGARVLLPRADIARDTLPEGLRAAGATVDVVVAYRTGRPADYDPDLVERVRRGEIDLVTFASPSTVRNLADLLGEERSSAPAACIGPITAAAAEECGFTVAIVADEFSIPGLVDALVRYRASREREGRSDVA